MSAVELERFTAGHLPLVEPWFCDPETQRWLGGPSWPAAALALAESPPPGTGRLSFLARREGVPVGLADLEIEHRGDASFAVVVAPACRRAGLGRTIVAELLARPELGGRAVAIGVESGNQASARLADSSGFPRTGTDRDGFLLYRRQP